MNLDSFVFAVDQEFGMAGHVKRRSLHPFLRLEVRASEFEGLDADERESFFAKRLNINEDDLRRLAAHFFVRWDLLAPGEASPFPEQLNTGWLELLDRQFKPQRKPKSIAASPRFVHFYGYKGGQGRSTILASLARSLAFDGWRVLSVDFDAEAPSLDLIFGGTTTDVNSTLLGLRSGRSVRPLSVVRTPQGGEVALLPFRPESEAFDLEAGSLATEFQNYPPAIGSLCNAVALLASQFDLVLIDHRTGLGPIVPTVLETLSGPVVVFSKLDGQSRNARSVVSGLWRLAAAGGWPGLLVSLAPPDEGQEDFRLRTRAEAEELLQRLAEAQEPSNGSEPLDAQELVDSWMVWPFEASAAKSARIEMSVKPASTSNERELRRRLGLEGKRTPPLAKSGAKDEGSLIVTQALRKLQSRDSSVTLVVGRKGTGKTRLVRALAEDNVGEPLLVPTDFPSELGGIPAGAFALKPLVERYRQQPELFWYVLLASALSAESTTSDQLLERATEIGSEAGSVFAALNKAVAMAPTKRVFLIDALESAFEHRDTFLFVRGLFRALEAIDATPALTSRVQLRLFVRKDLVERGIQNREQIEAGRRIDLAWDVQTIFNFALSRIRGISEFRNAFPAVASRIDDLMPQITEGQLETEACEDIMLQMFPYKLSYKNMATKTFLRTYFSDDSEGETSFYPRVYMIFLQDLGKNLSIVDGRIDGGSVVTAHQNACSQFLSEVSQELALAADVETPVLEKIFSQLDGQTTPFDVDWLAKEISLPTGIDPKTVREIFSTMKQLGIFEDYPKRPNQWRPGRLFKTALRMRFASGAG